MREYSAGAIVFTQDHGRKYLLLRTHSGQWGFPKGNVEPFEDEIHAARREVTEETGIRELRFIDGFSEKVSYFYKREGRTVYKTVVYFLARADRQRVSVSEEHADYAWLGFREALSYLTHESSKELLRKAEEFLSKTELTGASQQA